jgi:predicted RNase H-like HicB family nuclease
VEEEVHADSADFADCLLQAKSDMRTPRPFEAHLLHPGKWWVAWSDDVPGALTHGRTLEEARENLKDAIALMLEPIDLRALPATFNRLRHEVVER